MDVAAALALLTGCGDSNVPRVESGPGPDCPGCTLVVEEVWRSSPEDSLVNDISFALETSGELWTGGGFTGSTLVIYDLDTSASRSFGRGGEGPEELGGVGIARLVNRGGEIGVVHGNRLTRWAVPSGTFVSTRIIDPVVYPSSLAASTDEGIVLLTAEGLDGVEGWVVPLEDTLPAWGWTYPAAADRRDRVIVDAAATGEAWVGETRHDGVRLVRLGFGDHEVSVLDSLVVRLDWWLGSDGVTFDETADARPVIEAPPTRLAGLHDFGDHIVLQVHHADKAHADWDRQYWEPEKGFDTVFLAIQTSDAGVLATQVIDEVGYPFTNRGRTPVYGNDRSEHPSWSLREVRLVER